MLQLTDQGGQLVFLDPLLLDQISETLSLRDVLLLQLAFLVDVLLLQRLQLELVLLLKSTLRDLHLGDRPLHLKNFLRLMAVLLLKLVDHLSLLSQHLLQSACVLF